MFFCNTNPIIGKQEMTEWFILIVKRNPDYGFITCIIDGILKKILEYWENKWPVSSDDGIFKIICFNIA